MKKNLSDVIRAECPGQVRDHEPLSRHTSIRIGGSAECWYEPEDDHALARAVDIARSLKKPVTAVGGGSNLLVPEGGVLGLVVHLSAPFFKELKADRKDSVTAGAAVPLSLFLKFLIENGFGECEFLMGIPAQVGGALAMNAGSGTRWIGSYFVQGRVIEPDGTLRAINQEEAGFAYRQSALAGRIVTWAEFKFPRTDAETTRANLRAYAEFRRQSQDLRYPSVGCMFANPSQSKKSAGRLIDEAGLKGTSIGGARISDIHANFVVNHNGATHQDVVAILELVEKTIVEKFGIRLKREIQILE